MNLSTQAIDDIRTQYRNAADKIEQVKIISDLYLISTPDVCKILKIERPEMDETEAERVRRFNMRVLAKRDEMFEEGTQYPETLIILKQHHMITRKEQNKLKAQLAREPKKEIWMREIVKTIGRNNAAKAECKRQIKYYESILEILEGTND